MGAFDLLGELVFSFFCLCVLVLLVRGFVLWLSGRWRPEEDDDDGC